MVYFGPHWFLGYDVFFELVFALITLGIALYSYKLCKIVKNKNYYHFTAAFMLFSLSYIVRLLINSGIYAQVIPAGNSMGDQWIHFAGFYLSSILFLAGTVMLLSTTFSKTRDIRPIVMLFLASVIGFLFAFNKLFYLFSIISVYLLMICWHYFLTYYRKQNLATIMILGAFLLILLGQINYLFRLGSLLYVLGHVFELLGYASLLIILIRISRK